MFYFLAKQEQNAGIESWLQAGEAAKPNHYAFTLWPDYLQALYWSSVTAVTLGYGDFSPVSTDEYSARRNWSRRPTLLVPNPDPPNLSPPIRRSLRGCVRAA